MKIVGIDLAGVEKNPTGFCFLDEKMVIKTSLLFKDEEILKEIEKIKPDVVAIDAPLALPKGRKSLYKRDKIHFRECDKELLKMKIKFFPITLGPMRKLTERGIKLKKILESKKIKTIETYPGAIQDILKIPRKSKGKEKLMAGLKKFGLKGLNKKMSDHELDAATCALLGKMYLEGNYIAIGDPEEILMILPKPI
jgi:predicted nuclease with RNAse H fold